MSTTATATTTAAEQQQSVLTLRSDAPTSQDDIFPPGTALADLSRGPNPLRGATMKLSLVV